MPIADITIRAMAIETGMDSHLSIMDLEVDSHLSIMELELVNMLQLFKLVELLLLNQCL